MDQKFLDQLLAAAVKAGASDIHLKVGAPPVFRMGGDLKEVKAPRMMPEDTRNAAILLIANEQAREQIGTLKEYDGSYSIRDVGRFRVNIFKQRGTLECILRVIPYGIPSFEDLGLPPVLADICDEERGLILVTGVTGSGKSSTLAAMIGYINTNYTRHILTIEDPVEFLHKDAKSSISQREIGADTDSFSIALRSALREDPDVILLGEMRDYETIDIALKAAETGHLVLSTVHTQDAPKTVNRLMSVFPADEQNMVRLRLADSLRASVSQRLLPCKGSSSRRVVALEIMRTTLSVRECIRDPEKIGEMKQFIESGRDQYGMVGFDQHLSELYKAGQIELDVAKAAATNPSDFERALHFE